MLGCPSGRSARYPHRMLPRRAIVRGLEVRNTVDDIASSGAPLRICVWPGRHPPPAPGRGKLFRRTATRKKDRSFAPERAPYERGRQKLGPSEIDQMLRPNRGPRPGAMA